MHILPAHRAPSALSSPSRGYDATSPAPRAPSFERARELKTQAIIQGEHHDAHALLGRRTVARHQRRQVAEAEASLKADAESFFVHESPRPRAQAALAAAIRGAPSVAETIAQRAIPPAPVGRSAMAHWQRQDFGRTPRGVAQANARPDSRPEVIRSSRDKRSAEASGPVSGALVVA